MELVTVPAHFTDRAWKDGADQLGEATKRSAGEVTPDQLKMRISRGELILLCLVSEGKPLAWAAVSFDQLPNFLSLFVYAIYAPGEAYEQTFNLLCDWAQERGASRIRGACDEVIARLWRSKFGFKEAYRICEKEL